MNLPTMIIYNGKITDELRRAHNETMQQKRIGYLVHAKEMILVQIQALDQFIQADKAL